MSTAGAIMGARRLQLHALKHFPCSTRAIRASRAIRAIRAIRASRASRANPC